MPISIFTSTIFINDIIETALDEVHDGVNLLPREGPLNLEATDNTVLPCNDTQNIQVVLDQLVFIIYRYKIYFAPEGQVVRQDWLGS